MTVRPTLQERAYQLTAELASIAQIRRRLIKEGYDGVNMQLSSPTMRKALNRLRREHEKARAQADEAVDQGDGPPARGTSIVTADGSDLDEG